MGGVWICVAPGLVSAQQQIGRAAGPDPASSGASCRIWLAMVVTRKKRLAASNHPGQAENQTIKPKRGMHVIRLCGVMQFVERGGDGVEE